MDLLKTEKKMGLINLVAEILERARMFKGNRVSVESREERLLPPKDLIPPEKLRELEKDFNKTLKSVPHLTDKDFEGDS